MPCNSDYLVSTPQEREASKIIALLDELKGKPLPANYGSGHDPKVYNKTDKKALDTLKASLC